MRVFILSFSFALLLLPGISLGASKTCSISADCPAGYQWCTGTPERYCFKQCKGTNTPSQSDCPSGWTCRSNGLTADPNDLDGFCQNNADASLPPDVPETSSGGGGAPSSPAPSTPPPSSGTPPPAAPSTGGGAGAPTQGGSGGQTFGQLVDGKIVPFFDNSVLPLLYILAFLVFLIGMVRYFFSGADEEKRKKGREFAIWGIVGLVVLFSVWSLVQILLSFLTG